MTAHQRRPILFATVSHPGLYNPMAGIVAEVSRRGVDDVWFASTDNRKGDVEAMSPDGRINFVSLGPYLPELQPGQWSEETFRALNSKSRVRAFAALLDANLVSAAGVEFYQIALDVIDRIKPALMVIDVSTVWMLDAAQTRGVPYVLNSPGLVSYLYSQAFSWRYPAPFSGLPYPMTLRQKLTNAAFSMARIGVFVNPKRMAESKRFYTSRRRLDIKNAMNNLSARGDEAVAIIGHSLPGIDYPFTKVPQHLRMVGAVVPPPDPAEAEGDVMRWIQEHDSVVYMGFGSMNRPPRRQIEALLTAAERLGPHHQVLWSLPRSQHGLLPSSIPDNVRIETWVPQVEVLAHPHVRVFFAHGGNGTHQGLYFGKPLLLLPHIWEARDTAVRLVGSGAALPIDDTWNISPDEVTSKLRQLLTDEKYRVRAKYWQERYQEAGGASAAADIILKQLDAAR